MCGITGIVYQDAHRQPDGVIGDGMVQSLLHRGPDAQGVWVGPGAFLGHTRLSIIDLSEAGRQPHVSEDGNVVVIFNGEIYNHDTLRAMLIQRGHRFIGRSDGEILPHMYEEYGAECIPMLQGMFACAIYDVIHHRLILARDRIGIKPLYFSRTEDAFVFGSEIKAVLRHPAVDDTKDVQAILDYLSLAFIPEPATGFLHIEALLPGHTLIVENGQLRKQCFWSFESTTSAHSKNTLQECLDLTVRRQLIADVPLGVLLSGGVDSSLITSVASGILPHPICSFTVQFGEAGFDESIHAAHVAAAVHTEHCTLHLNNTGFSSSEMEGLLAHFDQPFGDSSAIPTYFLCREMQKHVKVALSGDGGDELFYGYPIFAYFTRILSVRPLLHLLNSRFGRSLTHLVREGSAPYRHLRRASTYAGWSLAGIFADMRCYFSHTDLWNGFSPASKELFAEAKPILRLFEPYEELLWSDPKAAIGQWLMRYSLPGDMLKKVDMTSMLAGIEIRVPLLDEYIVGAAQRIPSSMKHNGSEGKLPLRKMLEQHLPKEIAHRRKQGFAIPLDTFFDASLHDWVLDLLTGPASHVGRLFTAEWLSQLLTGFRSARAASVEISRYKTYQRVFMLLSLEIWLRRHGRALV
ncbi:MAG: asparagine synthase (glutamine-hydrolyzing) [Ignavibacteriae bacterium]|nr:asparagine synthase (glutamine-hydrolyzing) [Ignavibacteriota bacterium]